MRIVLFVFGGAIGAALFVVPVVVAQTLIKGFVLSILWGWFIVPLGLPEISIPMAFGITLIVGFLTHQVIDVEKPERSTKENLTLFATSIVAPFFTLFIGWIVHFFM